MKRVQQSWFAAVALACAACTPSTTAGPSGGEQTDAGAGVDAPGASGGAGGSGSGAGSGGMAGGAGSGGMAGGAGTGGRGGSGGVPLPPVKGGLGPWTGTDNVPPSQSPPAGLKPSQVPMFVTFGFDDNGYSGLEGTNGTGGLTWAAEFFRGLTNPPGSGNAGTFDGAPARVTFYLTATYGAMWLSESPTYVKRAWRKLLEDGHEIGNHTLGHLHGEGFDEPTWTREIQACVDVLTRPFDPNEVNFSPDAMKGIGAAAADIVGFRTPFLEYNGVTFEVLKKLGYRYDCSIEDGYQTDHDGTNFFWPYTLDGGSPGHDVLVQWGQKKPIGKYPGLWEFPANPFIVPPDGEAANYGVPPGLRAKFKALRSWFDMATGKVTGLDYNALVQYKMTKAEYLAVLKYTFDLRLRGNRAPFAIGSHSDYYSSKYTAAENITVRERQEAVEEFTRYVLSKPEVRVVTVKQMLDWIRNPVPLN